MRIGIGFYTRIAIWSYQKPDGTATATVDIGDSRAKDGHNLGFRQDGIPTACAPYMRVYAPLVSTYLNIPT